MENDILKTTEDKIDFLISEIEIANTKITELTNIVVSALFYSPQQDKTEMNSNSSRMTHNLRSQKERLYQSIDNTLKVKHHGQKHGKVKLQPPSDVAK
jgi:hypothetical protein